MKQIDEERLERDTAYRFHFLAEYMDFNRDDIAAVHAAAGALAPLVPSLVDAVYEKLHAYDATWRHFWVLARAQGLDTPASPRELTPAHPVIRSRKQHLSNYLVQLVTKPYDNRMATYLDAVGKIHTPAAGAEEVHVPLVQMNALLGFVSDALIQTILGLGLDGERAARTLRAFCKVLWMQNDAINRHYARPLPPASKEPRRHAFEGSLVGH